MLKCGVLVRILGFEILGFHCCGQGSISLWVTEISQIERPKRKKKKERKTKSLQSCPIQSDSRTE